MTERNETLTEVIDGRRGVYGEPRENFGRVAQVWSGIAGAEITAEMVPLMLIGYKAVRAAITPDYSDNSDDIEGYLDIFREIVGEDMIHARSVSEYLAKREERDHPVRMVEPPSKEDEEPRGPRFIWELGLDSSTYSALSNAGIRLVRHLTEFTPAELLTINRIGATRLERVMFVLAEHGLSLSAEED